VPGNARQDSLRLARNPAESQLARFSGQAPR